MCWPRKIKFFRPRIDSYHHIFLFPYLLLSQVRGKIVVLGQEWGWRNGEKGNSFDNRIYFKDADYQNLYNTGTVGGHTRAAMKRCAASSFQKRFQSGGSEPNFAGKLRLNWFSYAATDGDKKDLVEQWTLDRRSSTPYQKAVVFDI